MASFRNKAVSIYLALMTFNFIPQIRLRENREWNTCFRSRNSQIVYQLSPLYRLYRYVRRQKVWFFSRFGLK